MRVLLLVVMLGASRAYPELYLDGFANVAKGCIDPPTRGYGAHGAPQADKTTTFSLAPAAGGAAVTAACPGVPYTLSVGFGGSARRSFVSASPGSFAGAPQKDCPGATVSSGKSETVFSDTLTLPCTATGTLKLTATSAGRSSDFFHVASNTLPIAPLTKCPGSTCPGAPPATAAAAAATPAAAAAAAPAAAAATPAPADATSKSLTAGAAPASLTAAPAGGCPKSGFGYSCAVPAGDGATLHFSMGGADPPANPCTATVTAANKLPAAAADVSGALPVHFLLEAPAGNGGYAGLGFPRSKGVMVPADSVIGYVDSATGRPVVSAYALSNYQPSPAATNYDGRGWATNMGVAKAAPGGPTLLCFTRLADAPQAAYVKQLNRQAVDVNWAANDGTAFTPHSLAGSLTVNVADGTASAATVTSGDGGYAAVAAHGALMLAAFVVFMPLGGLTARHKWAFADKQKGGLRAIWFQLHRGCQLAAVLLALVGFIVALACFDASWSLGAPTPHKLYNAHRFLGVVVIALVALQAGSGFARPGLAARSRPPWRAGHLTLGWTSMALGIVVVFLGVVLMHDLLGRPWLDWLLPVVLLLGLVLAAGLVGELIKAKLERRGRYRPKTHQYGDSLDMTASGALKPHITSASPTPAAGAAAAGAAAGSGGASPVNGAGSTSGLLAGGHDHEV